MEVKDIAEYEEKDSRLARSTIAELHQEIESLNNIIIELKKTLWQRCEETRKNEQYVRLNCYKDILNELVDLLMQGSDKE